MITVGLLTLAGVVVGYALNAPRRTGATYIAPIGTKAPTDLVTP